MLKLIDEENFLVHELARFYYQHDLFQSRTLTPDQVQDTIRCLLQKGRIITVEDGKQVVAYVESWRVNFEQMGRIFCGEQFFVGEENINDGNILFLANITVLPQWRKTEVLTLLRDKFFEQNREVDYFVGHARRKRTGLWKVYKASEIFLKGVF